ncbi:hypothetical protein CPB83DRAFT_854504 [Crepidotus variabilis]|uniref:Uncharacterized protein n=1 Tax=Crepidotus variabilis TaxID=179855 RepID=A0A9P6EG11_9AGAR|nr:hypothetical protein CPB83DRAFT_854504 [Crepidotus variabilis]
MPSILSFQNATVQTSNGSTLTILNFDTPSAWLDPQTASYYELFRFLAVASLAIVLYDILQSLQDSYEIIFKKPHCFHKLVFVVSRLSCLACILVATLAHTLEISDCELMKYVGCALYTVAQAATGYLFYVRAMATPPRSKTIQIILLSTLMVLIGGSISAAFALRSVRIAPTRYCMTHVQHRGEYIVLGFVSQTIYDLLVCLFITKKLGPVRLPDSPIQKQSLRDTWFRSAKHYAQQCHHSQRFLQESQVYFLVALGLKIFASAWFYAFGGFNHSSGGLNIAFVFFDMVILNVLATNIYRKLILGKRGFTEPPLQTPHSPGSFVLNLMDPHSPINPDSKVDKDEPSTRPSRSPVKPGSCKNIEHTVTI